MVIRQETFSVLCHPIQKLFSLLPLPHVQWETFRRVERICHLKLLSVRVHWGSQENNLPASLGQCPELLLISRKHPSQDPTVCTFIQRVHRTSPKLTVTGSIYNHRQTERVARSSQTVERREKRPKETLAENAPSSIANEGQRDPEQRPSWEGDGGLQRFGYPRNHPSLPQANTPQLSGSPKDVTSTDCRDQAPMTCQTPVSNRCSYHHSAVA